MVELSIHLKAREGRRGGEGRGGECACMLGIKDPAVPFKGTPSSLKGLPVISATSHSTTLENSLQCVGLWEIPDPSIGKEQGNSPW